MTESTDNLTRVAQGKSKASQPGLRVFADLDFEEALRTVQAAVERSFSVDEIQAYVLIVRSAMTHQSELTKRRSGP